MRACVFVFVALVAYAHALESVETLDEVTLPQSDDWAELQDLKAQLAMQLEMPEPSDEDMAFVEMGVSAPGDAASLATYLPDSGPYDNPAIDTTPTETLPYTPSCTVRAQTIFEIRKMRADAKQIGMSIMYEIQTMEKRKAYIEQMTAYLNDRIRELNKVKRDLAAEQKWIQVSNQRIAELAQKEKLIKLQDVMSCIRTEKERLSGENKSKDKAVKNMAAQAADLENTIKGIRKKMADITNADGTTGAAGEGAAPSGGSFF